MAEAIPTNDIKFVAAISYRVLSYSMRSLFESFCFLCVPRSASLLSVIKIIFTKRSL